MSWLPKDKVVVPVDFSKPSEEALNLAKDMVSKPSGLYLVHVIEFVPDYDPNVFVGEERHEERATRIAEDLKRLAERHEVSEAQQVVLDDYRQRGPGLTVAKHAAEIGAELIVLPTHGYTGLRRLLMGSLAEQVLRHSDCPVLLLPHRYEDSQGTD